MFYGAQTNPSPITLRSIRRAGHAHSLLFAYGPSASHHQAGKTPHPLSDTPKFYELVNPYIRLLRENRRAASTRVDRFFLAIRYLLGFSAVVVRPCVFIP